VLSKVAGRGVVVRGAGPYREPDPRSGQLGGVGPGPPWGIVGKLGRNAIDLSLEEFRALLRGRRGAIKTFLLEQDRIAGIGNVYIQDPLFKARLHPLRSIQTLSGDAAGEHRRRRRAVRAEPVRAEGRLERQFPGRVPRSEALPGMRDAGGQDQDRRHQQLYLPELPALEYHRGQVT
jgi:Formamidopyrimidine-DNA glycosylase H2TH domain